ncbi:hypothetical protein FRB93_002240 [Tulasnella sp. JGI-2019a]|nr:hypothetical protein FRB93_002240 [Tulasnella sp. JGI-2019a]
MSLKQRRSQPTHTVEDDIDTTPSSPVSEGEGDDHGTWGALGGGSYQMTSKLETASLSKTLTWDALPEWMRDNQYIRSGYRRQQNSWKGCLYSIFGYLHNETGQYNCHQTTITEKSRTERVSSTSQHPLPFMGCCPLPCAPGHHFLQGHALPDRNMARRSRLRCIPRRSSRLPRLQRSIPYSPVSLPPRASGGCIISYHLFC